MPRDEEPKPGVWYETESGEVFTVASVNLSRGTIELRYLDNRSGEMDLAAWLDLRLHEIVTPDEWHGSMDDFLARSSRKES